MGINSNEDDYVTQEGKGLLKLFGGVVLGGIISLSFAYYSKQNEESLNHEWERACKGLAQSFERDQPGNAPFEHYASIKGDERFCKVSSNRGVVVFDSIQDGMSPMGALDARGPELRLVGGA